MSVNSLLNATIALIHGDMKLVREILRAPGSQVTNVPAVVSQLVNALDDVRTEAIAAYQRQVQTTLDKEAVIRELTAVQVDSLGIEPSEAVGEINHKYFMAGVAAVEEIISTHIKRLRYELQAGN